MGFSDDAKATILKSLTGKTQYATLASSCWIGLGTMPGSTFIEPDKSTGYGRSLIGNYNSGDSQLMGNPSNGNIKNSKMIFLPEATSSWGTVTHFALFSSENAATPIFTGQLKTSVEVTAGYVPIFRIGTLSITIV